MNRYDKLVGAHSHELASRHRRTKLVGGLDFLTKMSPGQKMLVVMFFGYLAALVHGQEGACIEGIFFQ